ncbi:MAG: thioredoxin [Weeksellaceae bacterium]|nr:thioredoxin [Weeksellaceae bacterium]
MKFQELINQNKPVIVDFFAEWCGPCKVQTPLLQELKQKMGDAVSIIKIDVDKNRNLASHYQIQSVPTLMIFKEGEARWRKSGVFSAEELEKLI